MKRLVNTCLLAASCAVGCSSSDPATEADYDDVAQSVSALLADGNAGSDVGAMNDSATLAIGGSTPSLSLNASGAYAGNHLGITYEYKATCSDTAGAVLAKCGGATDGAAIHVDWAGNVTVQGMTASASRSGDWQLSNLQSGTVTFAGEGDFTLDLTLDSLFRKAQRTYHLNYNAQYANVQLQRATRRIHSGTIRYDISAERTVSGTRGESEAKFHMQGVLEFNPGGSATLTLDKTFKYKLDTATGVIDKQ